MLRSLYIQNYALIEKLDISFSSGFSVITGETGAGKSIILGAIGLLLGQRADVKAIRVGASKCIIEARFDISAYGMQPFFEENELEKQQKTAIITLDNSDLITSYEDTERYIGRKADKNRKIYNGMIKTYFYQFQGPKPPRQKR